jgi:hypothetical protein
MTGSSDAPQGPGPTLPFAASFPGTHRPGTVVGDRPAATGQGLTGPATVSGIDVEGVIGIDHGALRIKPLVEAGWGRSCAAWGPFAVTCGLTASLLVLNGHNASENVDAWPSPARYVTQWVRGTQVDAVAARLWARRRHRGRDTLRRRLRALQANRRAAAAGTTLDENLAVGLLGGPAPGDPAGGGAALVMRSTGPTNGELLAGPGRVVVRRGVQNVPLHVVVIARESGVLYALGSIEGVPGTAAVPAVRPVWLDPTPLPGPRVWAGVHQAVLGQVGWGVDTRVDDVRVAVPDAFRRWSTTAHVAERTAPDADGRWSAMALAGRALVVTDPGAASGLLHAVATLRGAEHKVGVAVRIAPDGRSGWLLTAGATGLRAERIADGCVAEHRTLDRGLPFGRPVALQVVDDGESLTVALDGEVVLGPLPVGPTDGTGVGVRRFGPGEQGELTDLEVHPAAVVLPAELRPAPPPVPEGTVVYVTDRFAGASGTLHGRPTGTGRWEHTLGSSPFKLDGTAAVVRPGTATPRGALGKARALIRAGDHRNAYTVAWPDPVLADVTVTLEAPGTAKGQGERGRGGLVLQQDPDNLLIVSTWIDDEYDGTSVSSFLRIGGFEDVYDAVWTNVGRRITWGRPYDLRVCFDGVRYAAFVDGEPVLYRRITDVVPSAPRLRIERVGIVSNWEFGDDTGTRFLAFEAAGQDRP